MHGHQVGRRLLPAVITRHKACAVQTVRHMVERFSKLLSFLLRLDEGYAPALVDGYPRDQTGVIIVPANSLR